MTWRRILLYSIGTLTILLIVGYFIANSMIHKQVDEALHALPPSLKVTYSSLQPNLFSGLLVINGLKVLFAPETGSKQPHRHEIFIDQVTFAGIHFLALLRSHHLNLHSIGVEGVNANLDGYLLEKNIPLPKMQAPFTDALIDRIELMDLMVTAHKGEKKDMSLEGSLELDSVHIANAGGPGDTVQIGGIRFMAKTMRYRVPDVDEAVRVSNLELDSKKRLLRLDTFRIIPTIAQEEIGRAKDGR
jgi:hypothetical protein